MIKLTNFNTSEICCLSNGVLSDYVCKLFYTLTQNFLNK